MTCPPSLVHAIPERLRRCVHTSLQAASVMPEPRHGPLHAENLPISAGRRQLSRVCCCQTPLACRHLYAVRFPRGEGAYERFFPYGDHAVKMFLDSLCLV